MPYSPAALQMLEQLGIPLNAVIERHLQEFVEASLLQWAETGQDNRKHELVAVAAQAWRQLKAAAGAEGVALYLVSAFRSVERQKSIIQRKLEKGQSIEQILAVSAPPFFSEHHTGRAVDIGTPGCTDLEPEFEATPAFRWLTRNAATYGFELSYPPDNGAGYVYEPWHWRHVAS